MTADFATVINNYREKCVNLLRDTQPNTDEHSDYSQIFQVFDRDQTTSPNERVVTIQQDLGEYSRLLTTPKARAIARQWQWDFLSDTGQSLKSYS